MKETFLLTNELFPVVILAGGLATRLRPITETIPKSLVEVNGEPFVAHQLRLLQQQGIKRVVFCLGYLGEMIQDYVRDGHQFGLEVSYSFDGPLLLGTAGAIKKALPLLDDHFFVLYGDSYLPCDFASVQQAFTANKKTALMTVFHNQSQWDKSNVVFSQGVIEVYDKLVQTPNMHYIDYGLGIFSNKAFDTVPTDQFYDLATLYQTLLKKNELSGHQVTERFYETGSFAGIKELGYYLQQENKENNMDFIKQFLAEAGQILNGLDLSQISKAVDLLATVRSHRGRLFILGVGGSAANASHAVNDFRKIVGIEAYAPTDNVSELTARTNDEGWSTIFARWLEVSRLNANDLILVLSVGGGNLEKNVSPNLVSALQLAKQMGTKIIGIIGRDGGYTAKVADACIIIPTPNPENTTPHAEAFQAVVWHLLVSHPKLKVAQTKWESVVNEV